MIETIAISNLLVGMFVVEVGDGSFDNPTTRLNMKITSELEIAALYEAGTRSVTIDTEKGISGSKAESSEKPHPFIAAISEANEKMDKAVAYSRSMMEDVRLGKAVDPDAARVVVDSMLETIFRNESAALFLTKLGDYDDYTYMHCVNVSVLASVFGRHLGLGNDELHDLGLSGLLHDLGKAFVPDRVLNKPGKLTPEEFSVMQSHPLKGYTLLRGVKGLSRDILAGVLQHHEKWSGGGYPAGLQGEKINNFARIIAVVDIYDAMTSNRIYHKKRAETDVLGFLFKEKASFAPSYVELFVKAVGIYPPGTLVRLTDGRMAIVCAANPDNSLMPVISLVDEHSMCVSAECIDLSTLNDAGESTKIAEVLDQSPRTLNLSALLE